MNEQRLLDTFLDLVRLPCPSGREARAAAYCKDALEDCGCTVTIDDAGDKIGSDTGNLYAELAGTVNGTIILTAHLDCVQPCEGVNPQIVDGVIYSDGTTVLGGDDKVGVAAIIEAVRTLVEEGGAYPTVKVIFSVQEETGCRGAANFSAAHFETGEPCFVFDDAGDVGGACLAAPYHYTFRAQFTGKAKSCRCCPPRGHQRNRGGKSCGRDHAPRRRPRGCRRVLRIEYRHHFRWQRQQRRGAELRGDGGVPRGRCGRRRACPCGHGRCHAWCGRATWRPGRCGMGARISGLQDCRGCTHCPDVLSRRSGCRFQARTFMSTGGTDANQYVKLGVDPLVVSTGMTKFHSVDECLKVADLENTARLACALVRERARCS